MKNYVTERYKTREEWLANRSIGGSSAAAIIGLNPWETKLELYNSFFYPKKGDSDNATLQYGRDMEPLIRKEFALDHPNYKVRPPKGYEMYRSKEFPLLTATVDSLLTETETGRNGVLEIKTRDVRSYEDAEQWKMGNIPPHYKVQMLHYLLVLNDCEFAKFVARLRYFDFGEDGRTVRRTETIYHTIERSDEAIQKELEFLKAKEIEFVRNVEQGIPPNGRITFR